MTIFNAFFILKNLIKIKKILMEANFVSHKIATEKSNASFQTFEIDSSFFLFENLEKRIMRSFDSHNEPECIEISLEIIVS